VLIFDQLKKNDPQLRVLALVILSGLGVLLAGLWWVQIVSAREYQAHLEMQSFRTVRIPAVRGKIFDRNGAVLAENRATYDVSLYLEELRKDFDDATDKEVAKFRAALKQQRDEKEKVLRRKLNKEERKQFIVSLAQKAELRKQARYGVARNVVFQIGQMLRLPEPLTLNATNFERHCQQSLALPFTVVTNITPAQIALFEEQCTSPLGVDVEAQSTRFYPNGSVAAHLIGWVRSDNSSAEGEDADFSFRLNDYRGKVGIEAAYDKELRGKAGVKSVIVNNVGYRQAENIWEPATAGHNVVTTIDLQLQHKLEKALQIFGGATRGAAVVMDVESGDVLAMASSPTLNPNYYVQVMPQAEWQRISQLQAEKNRATQENYAPGSIFKTIVGLACLDRGLDPNQVIYNPGHIYVGKRPIHDLAAPGLYDFRKALMHSSNTYFISNGLRAGIENVIALGEHLHLGERIGLQTRQETPGIFPNQETISSRWYDGDSANIFIGQGKMAVTPLQMVVMAAAIANGGKVLWPRLVDRIEPPGPVAVTLPMVFPKGRVRDNLGVSQRSLQIVHDAMLADVEDPGGTGTKAAVPGLRICGKTGTAQVMNERNQTIADTVWFASFAPYEKPRFAVVVMVEVGVNEGSGGGTCAPIAHEIYTGLLKFEQAEVNHTTAMARNEASR
jgi:penicillin-binding protein 2